MIRCIYMRFIAPLTISLGRSSPCQVRCFNVTCSFFFFAVFAELVNLYGCCQLLCKS